MLDFSRNVVRKPWGHEYLVYDNKLVSGWILKIDAGKETSLHAHEHKVTGLIVLDGTVRVSFLHNGEVLTALDKRVIHPSVFHRTTAITNATLLETEAPVDKLDLVRFKDLYGRDGKPYEDESALRPREPHEAMLCDQPFNRCRFGSSIVILARFLNGIGFCKWASNLGHGIAVALTSGVVRAANGVPVIKPGHIVWSQHLREFVEAGCLVDGDVEAIVVHVPIAEAA
jgi:hypothetical protein